jgi:hypothetical protein
MRFLRPALSTLSVAGVGAALALSVAAPAPAGTSAGLPKIWTGHALYDVGVHSDVTRAQADRAAVSATNFTQFKATVKTGGKSYTYVLAGKNPAKQVTNPASTIKMDLIPTIMKFSNGDTWDPTKVDSCDSGASPLARMQKSPLIVKQNHSFGGTAIGTTQITDAFQRAEFWKYAQPTGINPTYHVNLSWTTHSPITIKVPNADAATGTTGCGNGLLGAAEINWLDGFLQSTVIPSLGVTPNTVPIFLLHNFVEYISTTNNCCVLGYHNAFTTGAGVQTYGLGMYDNSGDFSGSSDISALSHEVGEWQDDPYTNNPTPSWGNIGQVSGCQHNLEVGDPLSGTTFADSLNGFTYHPQELAFFSWFYHQSPSLGVHGWYSDRGTFTTFAAACP